VRVGEAKGQPLPTKRAIVRLASAAVVLSATGASVILMSASGGAGKPKVVLSQHFALFREPRAHAAASDQNAAAALDRLTAGRAGTHFGLDKSQAASVDVTPSQTVVAVPGASGACVIVPVTGPDGTVSYAGGCAPSDVLMAGQPVMSVGDMLVGLAPDGVATQDVALPNGDTVQAPVVQNVYVVHGKPATGS
jgi:hypothetical protein